MPDPGTPRQAALLAWFESVGRDLPWRPTRDPWAILVAELMLQQTQVARVVDRWSRFLGRFPTVAACARAPVESLTTPLRLDVCANSPLASNDKKVTRRKFIAPSRCLDC